MKRLTLPLLLVLAACEPVTPKVEGALSDEGGGLNVGGDGAANGTDGATDGTDGATDGTDGSTDGTDGSTDGGTDGSTDGGTDGSTDGGGTDGAGTDGGGDGGTTDPYPRTWDGVRTIEFPGYCEESFGELGTEVTRERDWSWMVDACGDCAETYVLEVDTDEICGGVPVATETYRGVIYDGRGATIVAFYEDRGEIVAYEYATASWDGSVLAYETEGNYSGYDFLLTGEAVIE